MALTRADLDSFIAAERAALVAGLPEKVAAMEALWRQSDAQSLALLQRHAHTLYGSTGTFGLHAVSAACKSLELAVEAWMAGGTDDSRARVERGLETLRAALAGFTASL